MANLAWIIPLAIWLIVLLLIVPYRVANKYKQLSVLSNSEVNDVIQLLGTETLTLRRDDEERLYSFDQILLAIADNLSVGILFNNDLVLHITKGLGLGNDGHWWFPEADITRLIGWFHQYGLVDIRGEPYQEYIPYLGPNYQYMDIEAPERKVQGTRTTCHLSTLGKRVIRQLRQQSTVHKEGSQ